MKINATLVKPDGLYGMVMPKKPTVCSIQCFTFGQNCACDAIKNDYHNAIQAAKDAAIRYEDQDRAKNWLPIEAFQTNKPGIYPLPESLEVEQIWQSQIIAFQGWQDCGTNPIHMDTSQEYRRVLRITKGA